MAEFTNAAVQTVAASQDVLFSDTAVPGNCSILHREGSGLAIVRGLGNQCRALYQVGFAGNIALPTGGTVGEISLAISVDGEALPSAVGRVTPTGDGDFYNVAMMAQVAAPRGCCVAVSVRNTSTQPVDVANATMTVTRIA